MLWRTLPVLAPMILAVSVLESLAAYSHSTPSLAGTPSASRLLNRIYDFLHREPRQRSDSFGLGILFVLTMLYFIEIS
jgi:hypothetical protein